MPLAFQAIETFGRRNAFRFCHVLADLVQTESTVNWAIQELHREEDPVEDHDSFFSALCRILYHADPELLLPRADVILKAPRFAKEWHFPFQERLQLSTWNGDQCWTELENICVKGIGKESSSNVDFDHAQRW